MRHKRGGSKLGRLTAHRWALFRNLLTALFTHERITTTLAKAKAVRPLADHLVTLAKQDNLHARRQALALVPDVAVVHRLFDTIGGPLQGPPGRVHAHPPDGHAPRRRRPGGDPGAGRPAGGAQGEGRRARSPPSRRAKRRRRRGRRRPRRGAAKPSAARRKTRPSAGEARGADSAPLAAFRWHRPLLQVVAEEGERPPPGILGGGPVVDVGPLVVEEGVVDVRVDVDLG